MSSPNLWYPGTPITIVGQHFGYLTNGTQHGDITNVGLPFATQNPTQPLPYLLIGDCPGGNFNGGCPGAWDTNNTNCQVYIANWTDTSITVIPGLVTPQQNLYQTWYQPSAYLSLLTDVSPLTFPAAAAAGACPVAAGDALTFTVTNPQDSGSATSPHISVASTGTPLH